MFRHFFLALFAGLLSSCTINVPETEVGDTETTDERTDSGDTTSGTIGETSEEAEASDRPAGNQDSSGGTGTDNRSYDTVCQSALPPGYLDIAIQKDGSFYETAAKIILEARTKLSPDEDTAQRLMYGADSRMWVHIPEIIRTVKGNGSSESELCLTVGNVNCRYIWGAKVYELDVCDFGVQPEDVLGGRYFSLEVHNSDLAPDMQVRAELKAVSEVR
jgi:hypothetical protein